MLKHRSDTEWIPRGKRKTGSPLNTRAAELEESSRGENESYCTKHGLLADPNGLISTVNILVTAFVEVIITEAKKHYRYGWLSCPLVLF